MPVREPLRLGVFGMLYCRESVLAGWAFSRYEWPGVSKPRTGPFGMGRFLFAGVAFGFWDLGKNRA